jgi:hypothetical protein
VPAVLPRQTEEYDAWPSSTLREEIRGHPEEERLEQDQSWVWEVKVNQPSRAMSASGMDLRNDSRDMASTRKAKHREFKTNKTRENRIGWNFSNWSNEHFDFPDLYTDEI